MRRSAAALWAAFALGAWQLVSVALLGTSPAAAVATALIGGLAILVVAAWGAVTGATWAVWLTIILGALFGVMPFVAGFSGSAGYVASDLITGVLLILLGVVAVVDTRQRARDEHVTMLDVRPEGPPRDEVSSESEDLIATDPYATPRDPGATPGGQDDPRRRAA